ncbi:MAG: NUDIX hydrolase [Bacilli bacterium]|nr:NUDIX hydrolase [Bacilli bacterium]
MKVFKIITDEDFGLKMKKITNPRIRFGARGIIINKNNEIGLLYKEKKKEYKLIGGGVKKGETYENAFIREAREEAGCLINIDKKIGIIKEIKTHDNFIQESEVFIAHVVRDKMKLELTEKEIGEGSKCIWVKIDKAIELIRNSEKEIIASKYDGEKSIYHTMFIVRRDAEILKYYIKNCNIITHKLY